MLLKVCHWQFFSAIKIETENIETIFRQLVECGGDTDTNCSIAGQIIGSKIGFSELPESLLNKINNIREYDSICDTLNKIKKFI